ARARPGEGAWAGARQRRQGDEQRWRDAGAPRRHHLPGSRRRRRRRHGRSHRPVPPIEGACRALPRGQVWRRFLMIKLDKLPNALRASLAKSNPPAADHRIPGTMQFRAAAADDTAELLIYGNIGDSWWDESVTAREVVEALRENTAARILVRINSYGGSVTDGIAIYNELRA